MEGKREAILLVDDERIVLHSAKRLLERKGFTVFTASNGVLAMDTLQRNVAQIGVILLDLSMPGMDGAETLEKLLAIDPKAKIVLFSGYGRGRELDPLFDKGAVGHIQKPFEIDELLNTLENVLH